MQDQLIKTPSIEAKKGWKSQSLAGLLAAAALAGCGQAEEPAKETITVTAESTPDTIVEATPAPIQPTAIEAETPPSATTPEPGSTTIDQAQDTRKPGERLADNIESITMHEELMPIIDIIEQESLGGTINTVTSFGGAPQSPELEIFYNNYPGLEDAMFDHRLSFMQSVTVDSMLQSQQGVDDVIDGKFLVVDENGIPGEELVGITELIPTYQHNNELPDLEDGWPYEDRPDQPDLDWSKLFAAQFVGAADMTGNLKLLGHNQEAIDLYFNGGNKVVDGEVVDFPGHPEEKQRRLEQGIPIESEISTIAFLQPNFINAGSADITRQAQNALSDAGRSQMGHQGHHKESRILQVFEQPLTSAAGPETTAYGLSVFVELPSGRGQLNTYVLVPTDRYVESVYTGEIGVFDGKIVNEPWFNVVVAEQQRFS